MAQYNKFMTPTACLNIPCIPWGPIIGKYSQCCKLNISKVLDFRYQNHEQFCCWPIEAPFISIWFVFLHEAPAIQGIVFSFYSLHYMESKSGIYCCISKHNLPVSCSSWLAWYGWVNADYWPQRFSQPSFLSTCVAECAGQVLASTIRQSWLVACHFSHAQPATPSMPAYQSAHQLLVQGLFSFIMTSMHHIIEFMSVLRQCQSSSCQYFTMPLWLQSSNCLHSQLCKLQACPLSTAGTATAQIISDFQYKSDAKDLPVKTLRSYGLVA